MASRIEEIKEVIVLVEQANEFQKHYMQDPNSPFGRPQLNNRHKPSLFNLQISNLLHSDLRVITDRDENTERSTKTEFERRTSGKEELKTSNPDSTKKASPQLSPVREKDGSPV